MQKQSFSIFEYFYRDSSNFKIWDNLLLFGEPQKELSDQITQALESGEFFIAEQVGIPSLYSELFEFSHGPTVFDHTWHTFHSFRTALPEEISAKPVWGETLEIARRFNAVQKWDFTKSSIWSNLAYLNSLNSNSDHILLPFHNSLANK